MQTPVAAVLSGWPRPIHHLGADRTGVLCCHSYAARRRSCSRLPTRPVICTGASSDRAACQHSSDQVGASAWRNSQLIGPGSSCPVAATIGRSRAETGWFTRNTASVDVCSIELADLHPSAGFRLRTLAKAICPNHAFALLLRRASALRASAVSALIRPLCSSASAPRSIHVSM
jgi:hypothetical protein